MKLLYCVRFLASEPVGLCTDREERERERKGEREGGREGERERERERGREGEE